MLGAARQRPDLFEECGRDANEFCVCWRTGRRQFLFQNLLAPFGIRFAFEASDDYAFRRHRVDAKRNKVYGFTMEFGYPTNFYPTLQEYHNNLQDTGAGLMEFCQAASDAGL
ncbi:hypothetical protein PPGU19_062190 (plasmid) [Paraburkholderia sp. PGU19]|nr:hypothetical protein PPGU19_062190 [Paraburkholderia sp. PGU19]